MPDPAEPGALVLMRAGHLSWLLSSGGGGIPPAIFGLAAAQRGLGIDARVQGVADGSAPAANSRGVPHEEFRALGPLGLGFAPGLEGRLRIDPPDLVHLHGLFTWPSHVARRWRRHTGRPVIVSPHGMLDPWALANSAWKKKLFSWLVEKDNLRGAACLHALCPPEVDNLRRLGLRNPVAILPNGVDLDQLPRPAPRAAFDRLFPRAAGRRLLLFMGRLHPKKGILRLLDAWATSKIDGVFAPEGWLLVVAGPDQLGHRAQIERRILALGLESDVLLTGPLSGDGKWMAFSAASGFVLPSSSEGFPVAVLEAMAYQLPVLLTRQCNIDAEALGAGLLCEPDAVSIANQLRIFLALRDEDRRSLGEKGRVAVEQRYSWRSIAPEMVEVYSWLLGAGRRPSCVEVMA
jgi:poly(glycerol-phosphate) alpha-glucosyltransferase